MENTMVAYEALEVDEKKNAVKTYNQKKSKNFFNHSVILKDDEIRKYSEAIIRNLDFLLAKLEEKISGVTSPKEVFDTLLDVLANNDIN